MLYQLSYEATHRERGQFIELINWPRSQYVASIHSSVGRASHRYRGSNPVETLIFFQASFQLLKLEIYCDDHSLLSSTTAVQIWIISYILHIIRPNSSANDVGCHLNIDRCWLMSPQQKSMKPSQLISTTVLNIYCLYVTLPSIDSTIVY